MFYRRLSAWPWLTAVVAGFALTLTIPATAVGLLRTAPEASAAPQVKVPSVDTLRKSYTAARVESAPPTIDGRLDDPAWGKAAWESGFVQSEPYEGREPSERTAFKILYDQKSVYVAVRAFDSQAGSIERRLARRDEADGDTIDIGIDSLFDRLTAFVFTVNATGVKSDQLLTNDGYSSSEEDDMSWDPIWDAAASVDAEGWSAELRIPLSQLRFGNKPEQVWGLQVRRTLFRKNESSDWQPIPRNASGLVHLFGDLRGLTGLVPPHQVEIMPYAVGRLQSFRAVPGNPYADGGSADAAGGIDGKLGVTGDLTLNFTINPDFGQVEADPSVVNLTAFETFYEEKRPFFVEGRNIINFQLMGGDGDFSQDNMFYSRRIGRSPQYTPSTDGFLDMPEATTILGAFKLTGKTKSGLSIGVLDGLTSLESAGVFSGGTANDVAVEPLTNYFALRAQQDFNQGATIVGAMATAVNRSLKSDDLSFLHEAAYVAGIDLFHSWKAKNYYVSFKGVASRVEGTPLSLLRTQRSSTHYFQRPDADYLEVDPSRTSLSGTGGTFEIGKQGGGHWMYAAGYTWRSPGLELNDIGYLRQADTSMEYVWVGYRIYEPFGPFRSVNVNFNQWLGWNFGGEKIFSGGNVNLNLNFKNYWYAGGGYNIQGESLSQSALRGGPALRIPSGRNIWFSAETDSRRKIRLSLSGNENHRTNGESEYLSLGPTLTVIPSPALQISLKPGYSTYRNILQYVGTETFNGESRYLFGAIDQTTLNLTVRLNYSLTPDLSIQFYGMPFVSAGRFSDFKRITDSRAKDFDVRYHLFGSSESGYDAASRVYSVDEDGDGSPDYAFANPDFNVREFRSNLVLRWEYIPGSALYVVWSQGRSTMLEDGSFELGRDINGLFDLHPHDVFLIKFSYCFQL
ncbi:MAG: DUF5916 domain-containing protein [Acidobacteriota bacterium]|nr:DUF5916 domain-containing protein [Acidobacteriota bacterium]